MKNGILNLESTNQRRGDNFAAQMRSHFDPLSFQEKKGIWLRIITLVLRTVALSMGMYNHIWTLKYCLEFDSKMVHNYESPVLSLSERNANFFLACFCEIGRSSRLRAVN
jgi:hypothetical protein